MKMKPILAVASVVDPDALAESGGWMAPDGML